MKYLMTILFLLITLNPATLLAQGSTLTSEDLREFGRRIDHGVLFVDQKREVKGTPYLYNEWSRGRVRINKNAETQLIPLRLNIENNTVEFARGEQAFALDSKKIIGFEIIANPKNIVFKNGFQSDEHDITKQTLLRIIQDGEMKFVAHHTASLKEDLASYGTANQIDEYVKDTNFYIVRPDGTFHEIKLKRKHILRQMKRKEKQVKAYIDKNNLDYGDEDDVARIIAYYNELSDQN